MTKKVKITIAIIACVIIVAGVAVWIFASNDKKPGAATTDAGENVEMPGELAAEEVKTTYSEPELREMATEVARENYGDDAFIIFLSSEGPATLEINGTVRSVYIYAADSRAEHDKTGKIRSIYHIDADTGEIFDNGNGNMEKIKTGE